MHTHIKTKKLIHNLKDIDEILIPEEKIKNKVKELADKISKDYRNKDVCLVSILKGSVVFLADLIRNLKINCTIDFIALSSYGSEVESSGVVRQLLDLRESPVNKHLLIVEDIVDTGYTLAYLRENLLTRAPKSLKICVFLDKIEKRKVNIPIDYRGFIIPNKFVVGYGLDFNERYRNLPFIASLKPEVIKSYR